MASKHLTSAHARMSCRLFSIPVKCLFVCLYVSGFSGGDGSGEVIQLEDKWRKDPRYQTQPKRSVTLRWPWETTMHKSLKECWNLTGNGLTKAHIHLNALCLSAPSCLSPVCVILTEYVQLYVDFLLNKSIYKQFAAFYYGFHGVCASGALMVSDASSQSSSRPKIYWLCNLIRMISAPSLTPVKP